MRAIGWLEGLGFLVGYLGSAAAVFAVGTLVFQAIWPRAPELLFLLTVGPLSMAPIILWANWRDRKYKRELEADWELSAARRSASTGNPSA